MTETIPRVCAQCEADQATVRRATLASHGLCRRHFLEALQHAGCSEAEIAAALDRAHNFCAEAAA